MRPRDSEGQLPSFSEGQLPAAKPEGPVFDPAAGPVVWRPKFLYNFIFVLALYFFYKAMWEMKSPISIIIIYLLFLLFILIIIK